MATIAIMSKMDRIYIYGLQENLSKIYVKSQYISLYCNEHIETIEHIYL